MGLPGGRGLAGSGTPPPGASEGPASLISCSGRPTQAGGTRTRIEVLRTLHEGGVFVRSSGRTGLTNPGIGLLFMVHRLSRGLIGCGDVENCSLHSSLFWARTHCTVQEENPPSGLGQGMVMGFSFNVRDPQH